MSSITEKNTAILYEVKDSVAHIIFNRPDHYNGVNHDMVEGLLGSLDKAREDDNVRALLLSGNGRGFCAGADLSGFAGVSPSAVGEYIPAFYGTIVRKITKIKKPVIAAIHGSVAGVGLAFALACDLRVMAESANMRFAFINIGLGTDGGAGWLLARTVGYSRAFEIAVEGEKIPADRCLTLGLTNKIVPDTELPSAAIGWAKKMAMRPTFGVGITKVALHHAMTHTLMETTIVEADNQVEALKTADHAEGVQAFLQKREPHFKGK